MDSSGSAGIDPKIFPRQQHLFTKESSPLRLTEFHANGSISLCLLIYAFDADTLRLKEKLTSCPVPLEAEVEVEVSTVNVPKVASTE